MPYKPQPGLRLHRRQIGEVLAGNDAALARVRKLKGFARTEAAKTYIAEIEIELLKNQVNLYRMFEIINDAEGGGGTGRD